MYNKHWASDVGMGAAIGTFAGWEVVQYHRSHPGNKIDKWLLRPSMHRTADGQVTMRLSLQTR